MKAFEIFITYISWGSDGKNRPVLALLVNENSLSVYPITTQYENKSKDIQAQYFKINDWDQAGLARQSYIDTGTLIKLPLSVINGKKAIGRLTIADKQRLLDFLTNA
jgi:hypothetical protein